jgi:hypothetical protein
VSQVFEIDTEGDFEVGCKKGKTKSKPKPGRYICKECGVVVKTKKQACDAKKIKAKKK